MVCELKLKLQPGLDMSFPLFVNSSINEPLVLAIGVLCLISHGN